MKKIYSAIILVFILLIPSVSAHADVKKENRLWQDESIYSIMIDRFNDGDMKNDINTNTKDPLAYNGGDFQGIIDKLDYIHDMGFTAIRLSPIFDNAPGGYHGFWVNNFYQTEEHFGSIKTFQTLVKEAHKRNMKVLVDFVANNVAASHPWTSDPSKQGWFHKKQEITDWNNQEQVENGWVDGLPDLNQDNPDVKTYLIDAAKWWIKKTDIDGYSLPAINQVPVAFWKDFSKKVKQEKKDFFLMGVPSGKAPVDLLKYENAGIDSMFDNSYSENIRQKFATTDESMNPLFTSLEKKKNVVNNPYLLATFMDNEYTARFTKDIVDKRQFPGARWKTAFVYLYTTPGIPVVYYGSEIALNGGSAPDNYGQMNFRADTDLIDYVTKLAKLRNQLPSLTRGTMKMLYEKDGMSVYQRKYKGETAIIAINNTKESQHVTLTNEQIEGGKELRGLLEGDLVRSNNNQYNLILDRDKAEIYVLTQKSGISFLFIAPFVAIFLLAVLFIWRLKKRK